MYFSFNKYKHLIPCIPEYTIYTPCISFNKYKEREKEKERENWRELEREKDIFGVYTKRKI